MNTDPSHGSQDDFDARLKQARMGADGSAPDKSGVDSVTGGMSGVGMAFRIGTDMVAALIVGVGTGWVLDQWLDTGPWMMIGFFFLGAAAGILNVYRTASGFERKFQAQNDDQNGPLSEPEKPPESVD